MEDFIKQKLEAALQPVSLHVVNESHLHAGHAGDDGSGQTHFRIKVVSDQFDGKSRVEKHMIVNALLEKAFKNGLHALSISASSTEDM